MNGLFLQGGGAKGAFQAGVIYGLYEKGYKFDIISGTSIGDINSYFIYKNQIEELKNFWLKNRYKNFNEGMTSDKVIDNQGIIDYLSKLEGLNETVKNIYVNYVHVQNKEFKEMVVDITKVSDECKLKAVKYSSLLPYRMKEYNSIEDVKNNFDSSVMRKNFYEDLKLNVYEGYNLDGGIANNDFLNPFIKNNVDRLYLIVFHKNYRVPDYIKTIYSMDDIIIIEPKTDFKPNDTLRLERDFLNDIFEEGYSISKKI